VRVRKFHEDDVFEVDTPNQAFSIFAPGSYRVEASDDGTYTVVTIRAGEGECTGNGQTYSVHPGQRVTLSGTNSLDADVEDIGAPDDFDNWTGGREHRYEESRSARYVSPDLVGREDLDDSGDWRPHSEYGNVWFPRVAVGWAPYHEGHWAWVDPWGWTWVDDAPWGYAPFHYGRWVSVEGRWGWIPGPIAVEPVYAPALVAFVGGAGFAIGGSATVAWFPLGPREVYVPSYHVSEAYVTQVNVSNTTVTQTTVTNVYKTTIVSNNTTITNVTYVNRNTPGAVTAVPQNAFASAQPVAKAAVHVTPQQLAAAPISARAAVAPTAQAVKGAHANTAGHVAAPPKAVMARQVVAKKTPPPPPPPFAARQQALAAHPGQPIPRRQLAKMVPAAAAHPMVKVAPPGKPATPKPVPAGSKPAITQPGNRPGNPPPANQPANRPGTPPAANRPAPNKPAEPPAKAAPPAKPQPEAKPAPPARPPAEAKPAPKPQERPPAKPQPEAKPAPPARPPAEVKPAPKPQERPPAKPPEAKPAPKPEERPPARPPAEAKPAPKPQERPAKPQTPEEKKKEQQKREEKPPGI